MFYGNGTISLLVQFSDLLARYGQAGDHVISVSQGRRYKYLIRRFIPSRPSDREANSSQFLKITSELSVSRSAFGFLEMA